MQRFFTRVFIAVIALTAGIIAFSDCRPVFGQDARAYQPPRVKTGQIVWSTHADGQKYVTTLKISQLLATPTWDEGQENPPLSARKALAAAQEVVARFAPYGKETKLPPPLLKLRENDGHWFWVVYFSPNDFRQFQSTFPVVVLMDGSSVLQ